MSTPVWVRKDVVLSIHETQLAEHGGLAGLRDDGLLESALGRPINLYAYAAPPPSLFHLAAAYGFGLAKNHPFVDGNKRTALVICLTFLALNGMEITASDAECFVTFFQLAAGNVSEDELARWLSEHSLAS